MKAASLLFALAIAAVPAAQAQQAVATNSNGTLTTKPAPYPTEKVKLPIHTWRITYTITEMDGEKKIGVQHQSLTMTNESLSNTIKMGSRVPIVTGTLGKNETDVKTQQVTYIDVGMTIDVRMESYPSGGAAGPLALPEGNVSLHTRIEQSTIAEDTHAMQNDPVIRETTLNNEAVVHNGSNVRIGGLDVPGSTRHLDIEVTAEMIQ